MAEKSIIWSDRANLEFKEILEYYTKRNGNSEYSLKILLKTEQFLKTLKENEFIGRLTSNKTTRVMVMDVYLIFYEIHQHQIEILSFWDNRQNPKDRIKKI